jgi:hypothetical protein
MKLISITPRSFGYRIVVEHWRFWLWREASEYSGSHDLWYQGAHRVLNNREVKALNDFVFRYEAEQAMRFAQRSSA